MPTEQNVLYKCSSITTLVALLFEDGKGLLDLFPSGFVNDKG